MDLTSLGEKMSVDSFKTLQSREREISIPQREEIFKTIFRCESVRVMKKVLSKKLRANENYQVNLLRMEVSLEEDPNFELYKFCYDAHISKSKNLRLFLASVSKL